MGRRRVSEEELIENDSAGPDIHSMVYWHASGLFRSEVADFAFNQAGAGVFAQTFCSFGYSKVDEFDLAFLADQNVLGVDVAMNHAKSLPVFLKLMRRMESGADLRHDFEADFGWNGLIPATCDAVQCRESVSVDPFQYLVWNTLKDPDIEHFDDVGVPHQRSDTRFIQEHLLVLGVARELRPNRLDRYQFFKSETSCYASEPDHGHSAFGDAGQQFISFDEHTRFQHGSFDDYRLSNFGECIHGFTQSKRRTTKFGIRLGVVDLERVTSKRHLLLFVTLPFLLKFYVPDLPDEPTLAISNARQSLRIRSAVLKITSGSDQGAQCEVGAEEAVLGSGDDCDLVISDGFVSRRHLAVIPEEEGVRVRDLGSRNGSFLGGTRFIELFLRETTVLNLGKTQISVEIKGDHLDVALSPNQEFGVALGASKKMRAVFALLEQASQTDVTVLFEGASGTGKDVLATSLHQVSPRRDGPLVVVDCGSIPENLIESELFGHEKGAFTGASAARVGVFEQAHGGTLFLDEIGELPLEMQPRLLRALETRSFHRVGGSRTITSDVRFVAATNRRLAESVRKGEFREDLYYRLNVVHVRVPSLAERVEDIPLLAQRFFGRATGDRHAQLPESFLRILSSHNWPGNARELRNAVERFATFRSTDPQLLFGTADHREASLSRVGTNTIDRFEQFMDLDYHEAKRQVLDELHRRLIPHVLDECGGNVSEAAKKLGIPRTSLHRMIKKLEH